MYAALAELFISLCKLFAAVIGTKIRLGQYPDYMI